MPKEKSVNPVQAAKKVEKAKQLKKQKAQVQAQRTEKLARRNPARIQRDIDELKALEQSGELRPHDRQRLAQLEKGVAAIRKAREALGDKAPQFRDEGRHGDSTRGGAGRGRGRGGGGSGGVLGKRRRDGTSADVESSDTDEDVKDIPMPRDTPPPIPRSKDHRPQNPNETPLGEPKMAPQEPKKPQIVYEAAPVMRDFRKEATRFMPTAVQIKKKLAKGEGKLPEPEELDELEKAGYLKSAEVGEAAASQVKEEKTDTQDVDLELEAAEAELLKELNQEGQGLGDVAKEAVEAAEQEAQYRMMEAEAKGEVLDGQAAERQLRHVEIEEVEDEDL